MMSIGEVARRAGLPASTIRYYERLGLLPAPDRVGGKRRYRSEALDQLAVLRYARASGLSLDEIRRLFSGRPYSRTLRNLARARIRELEESIVQIRHMQGLLEAALRCRCLTLEECGRRIAAAVSASPRAARSRGSRQRATTMRRAAAIPGARTRST